eukprot:114857_1
MFDSNAHEGEARHSGNHHSNSLPVSTDSTGFSTTEKILGLLLGLVVISGGVYFFRDMRQTIDTQHLNVLRLHALLSHQHNVSMLHRMFTNRDVLIEMTLKPRSDPELEDQEVFKALIASLGTSVTVLSVTEHRQIQIESGKVTTMSAQFKVKNIVNLDFFLHNFVAMPKYKKMISEISYEFPKFKHVVDDSLHTMSMPADGVASDAATD